MDQPGRTSRKPSVAILLCSGPTFRASPLGEIHRYEAPDSRHLSTLPMLAEVTDFL